METRRYSMDKKSLLLKQKKQGDLFVNPAFSLELWERYVVS